VTGRLGPGVIERVYAAAGVPVLYRECPTCLRPYDPAARLSLRAVRASEWQPEGAPRESWKAAVAEAYDRLPQDRMPIASPAFLRAAVAEGMDDIVAELYG
jgi:hypothetical protein